MSFKDLIPWRRERHELPVQRMDTGARNDWFDEIGLAPFFRQTEQLFDRFFDGFGAQRPLAPYPALDLQETEDAFHVSVELPGVDEKDVEVSLADGQLVIRGEKRAEREGKVGDGTRMERTYGRFERSIALPAAVEEDEVKAEYRRGLLEIRLPKSKQARREMRRIEVKSDGR